MHQTRNILKNKHIMPKQEQIGNNKVQLISKGNEICKKQNIIIKFRKTKEKREISSDDEEEDYIPIKAKIHRRCITCNGDQTVSVTNNNGSTNKVPCASCSHSNNNTDCKNIKLKKPVGRCKNCYQMRTAELTFYRGHPTDAIEEFIALTNSTLQIFGDVGTGFDEYDDRPQNKFTQFSIYDNGNHLCPVDHGLVERNVLLFLSGYLKGLFEENGSAEGGIPTKNVGPINEWWINEDAIDGARSILGVSTPYGEYYLLDPSPEYVPFMESVMEKMLLGKLVIEFVIGHSNPTFEELQSWIQMHTFPARFLTLSEDSLWRNAQYICEYVLSFEVAHNAFDLDLITTQCMRHLIRLGKIRFHKRQAMKRRDKNKFKYRPFSYRKAILSPLSKNIFKEFLEERKRNVYVEYQGPIRTSCGTCEACISYNCGSCPPCRDMVKFGGTGKTKEICVKRRCPNLLVQEVDDSDPDDEYAYEKAANKIAQPVVMARGRQPENDVKSVEWIGECLIDNSLPLGRRLFYQKARVGEDEVCVGDCVYVIPTNPAKPNSIGKILFMYQNNLNVKLMHIQWFYSGIETVLGETACPKELFLSDECENISLSFVYHMAKVVKQNPLEKWATSGGPAAFTQEIKLDCDEEHTYFYCRRYDNLSGRIEDLHPDAPCPSINRIHKYCPSCERTFNYSKFETALLHEKVGNITGTDAIRYNLVKWRNEEYRVGDCIYLVPSTFPFKAYGKIFDPNNRKGDICMSPEEFPEYYRRCSTYLRYSNYDTPSPFLVGLITDIYTYCKDALVTTSYIYLEVLKFYKPESIIDLVDEPTSLDLNLLFASNEKACIPFNDVTGKCTVAYSGNINDLHIWFKEGPNRFYFTNAYNVDTEDLEEPTEFIKRLGHVDQVTREDEIKINVPTTWPTTKRPLRCMDIFAGCGGLSEGLRQSGVAETLWAIETDEAAIHSFKQNHPLATVLSESCNVLLKTLLSENTTNHKGQNLPQKGDVELLCSSPRHLRYTGIRQFNPKQFNLFKTSPLISSLTLCEFYRPRFFILDNVRKFLYFKRSMAFKLCLRYLVGMGYQVAFGNVQAGNFGIPQSRRRIIIIAAAPGEVLPKFPEPLHVFKEFGSSLDVFIDKKKFATQCLWKKSAPYRTITVKDAFSDLPPIPNGCNESEITFNSDPLTHFQRIMRDGNSKILRDHTCKEMSPLVQSRFDHIPKKDFTDWRTLPNICLTLNNGITTKKILYTHDDIENGRSFKGELRGVCSCASGSPCDGMDLQTNTLIPWCLIHSGSQESNWPGKYGRLHWGGFAGTVTSSPEPLGREGKIIHPTESRVISVREYARLQGFPDKYKFHGTMLQKYHQIGTAFPPPLALAIGREIIKCNGLNENMA